MIPKSLRLILAFPFILITLSTFSPLNTVDALNSHSLNNNVPLLSTFITQIRNGQSGEIRGLYIPEILAATVVHQPVGDDNFVSSKQNIVTQFGLASQFGSTGLLAHNYLAGRAFLLMEKGQILYLIYGDGQISMLVVTEILRYQALESTSNFSEFIDLKNDDPLTTAEAFSNVYNRPKQVILQTCISMGHDASWGRLFVIAKPRTFYTPLMLGVSTGRNPK